MYYFVLSFTYKNIDISIRERLSIGQDKQNDFLKQCIKNKNIIEIFVLSTCNRVDFFVYTNDTRECKITLENILSEYCNINIDSIRSFATSYKQDDAIYHTFCVASALDSLVVGESQIVGQFKDAFKFAYKNKYANKALKHLMHYAIKCGAKVRNSTKLGSGSLSISSVAVKKAKQLTPKNAGVLVIGAGKMGMLAIAHLLKSYSDITLCNKSIQNAKNAIDSKDKYKNINILEYEKLKDKINDYELVFCATSAPGAIITKDMLSYHKNKQPRYWFDLALPRDISDDIYKSANKYNLSVYSVDDLKDEINTNSQQKEKNAKRAIKIVSEELNNFKIWLKNLTLEPILKDLYLQNEKIAKTKIQKAIKKGHIQNINDVQNLEKLTIDINKKIFHNFSKQLRKNKISQSKIEFIKQLFSNYE